MMKLPIIFMFSGQGSQYFQMGKELYVNNVTFKEYCQKADKIYQTHTGMSLLENVYSEHHTKSQSFSQTIYTHPAIFMVEFALMQALLAENIIPNSVLGTSLGEFAAASTAGIMDFEQAFETVIMQAQALDATCLPGSMLAVLADPACYQSEPCFQELSQLAAVNFSSHFVVSGTLDNLKRIMTELNKKHIASQLLPVSVAFHSSLIDPAKIAFLEHVSKKLSVTNGKLPFISCTHGQTLEAPSLQHWWDIIRLPIQFQATIKHLEQNNPACYVDVGPSGTLATFVKYNLSSSSASIPITILSPFGQDEKNLKKGLALLKSID